MSIEIANYSNNELQSLLDRIEEGAESLDKVTSLIQQEFEKTKQGINAQINYVGREGADIYPLKTRKDFRKTIAEGRQRINNLSAILKGAISCKQDFYSSGLWGGICAIFSQLFGALKNANELESSFNKYRFRNESQDEKMGRLLDGLAEVAEARENDSGGQEKAERVIHANSEKIIAESRKSLRLINENSL